MFDNKAKPLFEFGIYNPLLTKKQRKEIKKMVKTKVQKAVKIDDGRHEGVIKDVVEKQQPYNYLDIVIKEKDLDIDLKCGVPVHITENSALGRILINFGATLEVNKEVDSDDYIKKGMKVEFSTITEETKKGNFARVVPHTLKPIK
jgi:hypothetical protein